MANSENVSGTGVVYPPASATESYGETHLVDVLPLEPNEVLSDEVSGVDSDPVDADALQAGEGDLECEASCIVIDMDGSVVELEGSEDGKLLVELDDGDGNDGTPLELLVAAADGEPDDAKASPPVPREPKSEEETNLLASLKDAIERVEKKQGELDQAQFEIGRDSTELHDQHGWTLKEIGVAVSYSEASISQFRSAYLMFPEPEDRLGMTVSACIEARKIFNRLPKKEKTKTTPVDVLRKMQEEKLSVRQASAHFHKQALKDAKEKASNKFKKALAKNPGLIGQLHNASCLDVLSEMPEKSVKVLWADPPYGQFVKVGHGGYVSGRECGNGLRTDCENNSSKEAVPLTVEMFKVARRVVRDDGCLIMWSAGMHEDRPEIVLAAREAGWRVAFAGYWKKQLTQPCKFEWPWSTCVERFLVWYPVDGVEPLDHSQELPRTDVITPDDLDKLATLKSPSQMAYGDFLSGRKDVGDVHMFEKPTSLCRYFLEKLTFPGDVVVDLFGCSGNMCAAAVQIERPWVYIELNKENFEWGAGRIADAIRNLPKPPAPPKQYRDAAEALDDLPF